MREWKKKREEEICSVGEFERLLSFLSEPIDWSGEACTPCQGTIHKSRTTQKHTIVYYKKRTECAHRVFFRLFSGPIPDGLHVLHKCASHGNCVNPAHLYLGTQWQNAQDRYRDDTIGKVLSLDDVEQIRKQCDEGVSPRQISAAFGISRNQVYAIKNRRCYTNL